MPSWYVIRNPVSGNGKGERHWLTISQALQNYFTIESVATEYPWHASELAFGAFTNGARQFIVCGGDGTLHEVVNGISRHGLDALKTCIIGVVPIGTGNDWSRTMGLRGSYEQVTDWLQKGRIIQQDLLEVSWTGSEGSLQKRLAVNMVGAGFDSFVAQRVSKLVRKRKGIGKWTYLLQLAKCLFLYKPATIQVSADDLDIHESLYTVAVGTGRFNGGGMMQCPKANPIDGILDLTIVRAISRFVVIRELPGLFNGSFVNHPKVSTHHTSEVTLAGPWLVEADGEPLGPLPATIRIIPSALPVLVHPKKADQWSPVSLSSAASFSAPQ